MHASFASSRHLPERNEHGQLRYALPETIDEAAGNAIRRRVQSRVKGPIETYRPEVGIVFAMSLAQMDDENRAMCFALREKGTKLIDIVPLVQKIPYPSLVQSRKHPFLQQFEA